MKRKRMMGIVLILAMILSMIAVPAPRQAAASEDEFAYQKPLRLYYDEEAPYGNEDIVEFKSGATPLNDGWERWSIPLGNGYMGVNVFGRTETERLQITENSMVDVRSTSTYGGLTNFAEVYFDFGHTNAEVTDYSRDLLLDEGTAHVQYTYEGVNYSRELFASYPDKVTVVKLSADQEGKIGFTLRAKTPFLEEFYTDASGVLKGRTGTVTSAGDTITLSGKYGTYEVQYEGQIKVIPQGGTVTAGTDVDGNGCLTVAGANSAYVLIGVGTNYPVGDSAMFTASNKREELAKYPHPHEKVTGIMAAASAKSYEQLLASHQADYKELFGRVKVDLGGSYNEKVTTDQLMDNYKAGTYNKYLEALYFQYGRYLLICSSRKGTLPPNLQGIWNRYKYAPWTGGYWHNINIQMNYWPVFSTNLAELFDCYIDYFNAYLPKAEALTQSHILSQHSANADLPGGSGWSISTGASPYSMGIPGGRGTDGYGTGALMAKSFYEYYEFTQDQTKLEEVLYPAVLGAALFMTKVMEPYGDYLLADPSASPEQWQDGHYLESVGTAWDQQNAYEMHKDAIELAKVLGKENDAEVEMLEERMNRLDPVIVGASGQVKEFREENYYGEIGEYNHRHISQLVGLYPGTIINETTPAWFDAAAVTMTKRGDKSTGWAMAHRLNLWARTKRGERAYALYQQLLKTGTNNNLWDTHPPFQIDGNLGGTSGVAEMLLQSHEGYIEPLPAIPAAWSSGNYSGLVARGNFEVAAKWSGGQMETIRITSRAGETCRVKYYNIGQATVTASDGSQVSVTKENGDLIRFATKEGVSYTISEIPSYTAVKAPSNLNVSLDQTDFQQASLTWTASEDAASYTVYRAEESAPDYTVVAENVTGTSYTHDIPEASVGKQATYRVTATASNGRESQGTAAIAEAVTVAAPEQVTGQFVADSTLQVTASSVENADGYTLYEKRNGEWEACQKSNYRVIVLEHADPTITYGVSARRSQWESDITEMISVGSGAPVGENVFLNQRITGTASASTNYPYVNALDGNLNTRYAVRDSADPYSVTITLDGTYLLDTMRIYEYKPDEGGTRSGNTKIELQIDGVWETVIENQSLNVITANGQYTSFALGNRAATAARITFQNTSGNAKCATIWEIQCSGTLLSKNVENVFLNQTITGTKSASTNFPYVNALDGNLNTRYAAKDSADPYSVTITLDGTYLLDTMRIYEYKPDEGGTRSGNTKIELQIDGVWETVIENQSLNVITANGQYTSFALGNRAATAARITFQNTSGNAKSATIWEIQCSGMPMDIGYDKTALCQALLLASAVDTGNLSETQLTEWNTVLTQAENVLNNENATQSQVDQAASALRELAEGYNAVMPEAPTASNVRITGTAAEYETLTLTYDYNDANQGAEQGSKYLWQVSDDGESWTDIAEANEKTYVAPNAFVGKYLRALVKPCSDTEPSIGVYTPSEAVGPIAISPNYESFAYTDLLLEHTQTAYTAGSSGQIHVTGTADRGGRYDITGHGKLTYESSDPMVAEAEDGTGILTLGKEGTAVVTAVFHNDDGTTASASVVIIVYNGSRAFEGFETKTFDPAVDTHIAKVTDPVNTGSYALKISKYPSGSTSTQGKWNRYDIYRSTPYTASMILQGWFYDNGTNESADAYIYFQSHNRDEDGNQLPSTGLYNVGLQTGISNRYYSVTSNAVNRTYEKTGTNFVGAGNVSRALDGQNGFDAVPRSKGWHQVVYVSNGDSKDRFTDQGTVSIYVDGVLAFTEQYVNPTMNVAAGVAAYSLPQFSYYDDLMICQYISKKPVTVTYGQGGTVSINGQTVESGVKADYDVANGLSLVIQPESEYRVDTVIVNEQQMIPDENGIVTLSNITGATNVAVTFTQLTETPPQVSSQPEYNWFKTEENKPVIYTYGKLNQYYQPDFEAGYGMKIWRQSDPANALLLPAYDVATKQPAKAAPGQEFAIKMYGEAISQEETYVVQPYVGDNFGEEVTMTFEE